MEDQVDDEVHSLPMEDTVWILSKQLVTNENDEEEELWSIVDEKNVFIGASSMKRNENEVIVIENLMKECLFSPLSWIPRRPRYITFRDQSQSIPVMFTKFGIETIVSSHFRPSHNHADLNSPEAFPPMQCCSVCRRRGMTELFITCNKCAAIFYCSEQCSACDLNHSTWCSKMAVFLKETKELADVHFTFASETTGVDFDERKYKDFQEELKVYGKGLWRREGPCPQELRLPNYGELLQKETEESNNYVLDDLNQMFLITDVGIGGGEIDVIKDWKSYYRFRGLELSSPAAILMQWPLTIYHVLVNLMQHEYPEHYSSVNTAETIRIHIIGVEKELDILTVFDELQWLMPSKYFDIHLIGCEISKICHTKVFTRKRIRYQIEKGLYHSSTRTKAHLVIGFNSGLGAYRSWVDTMMYLKTIAIPTYFTDYCRYSCECSCSLVEELKLGTLSDISVNPFRSPVRKYSEGNAFPWYSNGFVYNVKWRN